MRANVPCLPSCSSIFFPLLPPSSSFFPLLPPSSPFFSLLPPFFLPRYGPGRPDWENHKDKLVNGWDEDARSAFKKLSAEEGAARGAKWTDISARAVAEGYDEGAAKAGGKVGRRGPLAGSITEARKARKGEALARQEREWKREAAEGRKNKKDGKKKKKKKKKDRD